MFKLEEMDPAQPIPVPEQNPAPGKKKPLIPILIALFIILIGVIAWVVLSQKSTPSVTTEKVASSSANTATVSPKVATTSSTPAAGDTALITKALVAKTNISAVTIDVTVSSNDGTFAKGFVGVKGEQTGGGYFLAVKVGGNWIIAYDGQATPDCTVVNPYNFPNTLVPQCLDANGNLVNR